MQKKTGRPMTGKKKMQMIISARIKPELESKTRKMIKEAGTQSAMINGLIEKGGE